MAVISCSGPFVFVLSARSSDIDLAKRLEPHVRARAAQAPFDCLNLKRGSAVIQGLLLLAIWQLPSAHGVENTSWMFCGNAMHLAIHYGLHRSKHFAEYGRSSDLKNFSQSELLATWLGCYAVSQILSSIYGYPPTVRADFYILESISGNHKNDIHPTLVDICSLAYHMEQSSVMLGCNAETEDGLVNKNRSIAMHRFLSEALATTEEIGGSSNLFLQILRIWTRLKLRIQTFHPAFSHTLQEEAAVSSLRDATRILSTAIDMFNFSKGLQWPGVLFHVVTIATTFIFKIQMSCFSSRIDEEVGRNSIATAKSFFQASESDSNPLPSRIACVVDGMIKMAEERAIEDGGLMVEKTKTRMGANVFFEFASEYRKWRQQNETAKGVHEIQTEIPLVEQTDLNYQDLPIPYDDLDNFWNFSF